MKIDLDTVNMAIYAINFYYRCGTPQDRGGFTESKSLIDPKKAIKVLSEIKNELELEKRIGFEGTQKVCENCCRVFMSITQDSLCPACLSRAVR